MLSGLFLLLSGLFLLLSGLLLLPGELILLPADLLLVSSRFLPGGRQLRFDLLLLLAEDLLSLEGAGEGRERHFLLGHHLLDGLVSACKILGSLVHLLREPGILLSGNGQQIPRFLEVVEQLLPDRLGFLQAGLDRAKLLAEQSDVGLQPLSVLEQRFGFRLGFGDFALELLDGGILAGQVGGKVCCRRSGIVELDLHVLEAGRKSLLPSTRILHVLRQCGLLGRELGDLALELLRLDPAVLALVLERFHFLALGLEQLLEMSQVGLEPCCFTLEALPLSGQGRLVGARVGTGLAECFLLALEGLIQLAFELGHLAFELLDLPGESGDFAPVGASSGLGARFGLIAVGQELHAFEGELLIACRGCLRCQSGTFEQRRHHRAKGVGLDDAFVDMEVPGDSGSLEKSLLIAIVHHEEQPDRSRVGSGLAEELVPMDCVSPDDEGNRGAILHDGIPPGVQREGLEVVTGQDPLAQLENCRLIVDQDYSGGKNRHGTLQTTSPGKLTTDVHP